MTQATVVCQENDNAEDPDYAELTCGPESTDSISDKKGQKGTSNRTNLYHGRDIPLDVGISLIVEIIQVEGVLELLGIEGSVYVSVTHAALK